MAARRSSKAPATKTRAAKRKPAAKKPAARKKPAVKKRPAAKKKPAAKPKRAAPALPAAPAFDVDALLARLEGWCETQQHELRLTRMPALSEPEIDRIPSLLASFPYPLPTPYEPARFHLPHGYRELLRRTGGLQIEHRVASGAWEAWPVVSIYRPGDCAHAHQGKGKTLADSWTVIGTTVDDRAFTTTDFISFADVGFAAEASRWCFYLGGDPGTAPSIYIEDNDFECLLGRYLDTGEWISDLHDPVFPSFEAWLTSLCEVVCSRPFDPDQRDAIVNAILERGTSS